MKRFKKIYIEITNVCNLACSFCPQTKRKAELISIKDFRALLDQIKPYTDYIYFHVKGEPFLHPHLDELLDISYEKGFKVNITTNGTLIHQVKEKIILKPALRQINFSLHSFDGAQENNNEYIYHIISFIKEAVSKTNMLISLRLWNLDQQDTTNIQNKKSYQLLEVIEKEFSLPYKIKDTITPGRGIKINNNVYINQDYEFQWPDLKEQADDGIGFCYGLRDQIAILVDGTVVPCCLDGEGIIDLGNIYKTEFSQIVTSERAENIYNGFSRREAVEELCKKCGYRKKFGI